MRFMMGVTIPVEAGNAAAKTGKLGSTIQSLLEDQTPEAVYFVSTDAGTRSAFLIVNLDDASRIPALAEPWFLAFNAKVNLWPVFTPEELPTAMPDIEEAVKKYA